MKITHTSLEGVSISFEVSLGGKTGENVKKRGRGEVTRRLLSPYKYELGGGGVSIVPKKLLKSKSSALDTFYLTRILTIPNDVFYPFNVF